MEDHGLLQELTKTVQHSLIATTNEEDFLWWSSVAGQTYLKLQAAAIQRGVRIERIFIYRYRFRDFHKKSIASIAILIDTNKK